MDSDEESVINEDELRGKPQNPQQPHPPQGKDHLYLEAARRIGVSPSELRPVTVAQLIAKGMSKESAERKAVLLERSRIVLLGNVEKETRRLCQTRKNINRARPKIDTQESNSFGKGYSIVSEDVISDCDSSDKSDETNEVEENSHPRQKSHGPSFIRKSRVNPAAAAIKKFLKPNTTGKLTRYLNNGETVTKELTLTDLAKMRMNISKGNITHKLKLSISRKEEDLKAEHDAKERDRERLFECYEQRREEQVKQQKWMQERVERAEQVKQKQEAMKALRDERQRQVEEKHLANDSRRRHVARRRADVMTIRSNATNEQLVQNTSVNQQNKEANDTQFNTRVRDVQKRKYEKERRSVDAIQRRAQICKDTARAHKLHIEATQRRAQRNSSLQKTMQQYKADQDAMRSARWSQASGKANTFLAQQYSEANLHRTSVYQKHRKIESDKRELCDLLNDLSDKFSTEHKSHIDSLTERRIDCIAHTNEEKQKKAVRARKAQSYKEDLIREAAEERLDKYDHLIEELNGCWKKVTKYGQDVRTEESKMRSVMSAGGQTKQQLQKLQQIVANSQVS